jgi:hypothetical protein
MLEYALCTPTSCDWLKRADKAACLSGTARADKPGISEAWEREGGLWYAPARKERSCTGNRSRSRGKANPDRGVLARSSTTPRIRGSRAHQAQMQAGRASRMDARGGGHAASRLGTGRLVDEALHGTMQQYEDWRVSLFAVLNAKRTRQRKRSGRWSVLVRHLRGFRRR